MEFRLRLIDPKKRSSKLKENEAIQFDFDINTDDCDETCSEMCRANIINEEDLRNVTNLMKVQIANLKRDRREKQAQDNAVQVPIPTDNIIGSQQQNITGVPTIPENQLAHQISIPNQPILPIQSSEFNNVISVDSNFPLGNSILMVNNSISAPNVIQSPPTISSIQNVTSSIPQLPNPIIISTPTQINPIQLSSTSSIAPSNIPQSDITNVIPTSANIASTDNTNQIPPQAVLPQNAVPVHSQIQQSNVVLPPQGITKQESLTSTPQSTTNTTNQTSSTSNTVPKRRTNKSTERCPKLVVLSITNNTLVECQMQNKQKTITFKFDIDDVNLVEIANNLVIIILIYLI